VIRLEIFHLYIREKGGFEVTTDPAWATRGKVSFTREQLLVFDEKDRDLNYLMRRLHDRTANRIMRIPDQTSLASLIGKALFRAFISQQQIISDAYSQYRTRCLARGHKKRMCLHLPESLYDLPWEVLHDPQDPDGNFIAVDGSVVRYDVDIPETDFQQLSLPLKVWFLYSNPADRPFGGDTDIVLPENSAEVTFQRIEPATFDKFQVAIRVPDPRTAIAQPSIFAFFGHGDIDPKDQIGRLLFVKKGEQIGWQRPWVSDPRASHAVKDTIVACPALRIAFLCACESAWAQTAAIFKNSIAGYLLKTAVSVAYVIGSQTPIDSLAANVFLAKMVEFLPTLPIDLALSEARAAVRAMNQGYSQLDWWVPVLYVRAASLNLLLETIADHGPRVPMPAKTSAVIGLEAVSRESVSLGAMVMEALRRISRPRSAPDATRILSRN
jgi:hypothetical protein